MHDTVSDHPRQRRGQDPAMNDRRGLSPYVASRKQRQELVTMRKTVIVVTRSGLGTTAAEDAEFGVEMLDKFFHSLERQPEKPHAICFYTEGVKLLVDGSAVVLGLKLLEALGVRIIACQSCLHHYDLQDRLAVGKTGGMPDIVQLMREADKVITV
ncbi:MAG: DsrE family protein [Pirellulaceae bacterium]